MKISEWDKLFVASFIIKKMNKEIYKILKKNKTEIKKIYKQLKVNDKISKIKKKM